MKGRRAETCSLAAYSPLLRVSVFEGGGPINDSKQQKRCVLLAARTVVALFARLRVWIEPRSVHLPRSANRQRSQTDCWQLDSRLGQTSDEESSRESLYARPAWESRP